MTIKKKPTKIAVYPGWDLLKDGVSQSLLTQFRPCRDRAHKRLVLGLKSTDRKEAMEYGTIFHKLIEEGAKMGPKYSRDKLIRIMSKYIKVKFPYEDSVLLSRIAITQYHIYKEWESNKPKYKYIAQEPVFKEPYILPATNFNPCPEISIKIPKSTIYLRGRIDEVIEQTDGIFIQENKTKSRIDVSTLQDTIPENIQVMFYAVAAGLKYKRPIKGVIYNIIRKPGQRRRIKDTDQSYLERIEEEISKDPEYYFYRLAHAFTPGAIKKWEREELIPLLYEIYIWWKSISKNPTKPWEDEAGNINPFHGRRSFGMYDALSEGKGEFFDLIIHGRKTGLTVDYEMFSELKDDEE